MKRSHPNVDVIFLGDCNDCVDDIIKHIPVPSSSKKVLTFCFVDPYSLDLDFLTIKTLSNYFVDFPILLALAMDGVRNERLYVEQHHDRIDKFLGDKQWRSKWEEWSRDDSSFMRFLAGQYVERMSSLRYSQEALRTMEPVRSDKKNLPLYHLAFFSRSSKGYKFWKEVCKYHTDQTRMEFQ